MASELNLEKLQDIYTRDGIKYEFSYRRITPIKFIISIQF